MNPRDPKDVKPKTPADAPDGLVEGHQEKIELTEKELREISGGDGIISFNYSKVSMDYFTKE